MSAARAAASGAAYSDDFSGDAIGGPAAGWNVVNGSWSVCGNGNAHAYCETSKSGGISLAGTLSWTNYAVDALVTNVTNAKSSGVALIGRAAGPNAFYTLEIRPRGGGSTPYWYLWKNNAGRWTALASGPLDAPDAGTTYHLRLTFSGSSIAAAIAFDGSSTFETLATVADATFGSGQVGIHTWNSGAEEAPSISVTLAGSAPVWPGETAVSPDALIGSIGMNAHFESPIYYNNPARVRSLVANLGIRHYRVSAANILFPNGGYLATLGALHQSAGVTFDVLSDLHTTPDRVVNAIALLPAGSVDSVEGPSETDDPNQGDNFDPKFAVDVPPYMRSLYATIKANAATATLPVIGPAFVNSTSYAAVGNISNSVDAGNMHDYFAGFNPGTPGWGGTGYPFGPNLAYGSIDWNIASAGQATAPKPVDSTETGYYTAPIHNGVPFDIQAKYAPRLFLEHFLHGVPRVYLYQLIGTDTTTATGTLDIVSPSLVTSPAYTALSGLIGLLSDGNASAPSVTRNWLLGGETGNVHHLLMQKADGTLMLALWIETKSFDPNANGGAGARITVPAQTVTAAFDATAQSGVKWTCNVTTGTWSPVAVALTNGALRMGVTDTVLVLELPPG